ncbi:hypothetical protein KIH31_02150 [Paenarthrobacter sp. DKR-5]|uniref:hypothetical protein n=1 Tax=Paenarthrobacter sp. DKR-5 TaxID=2835535 RepID=UPI001BDBE70B|nr:hypothetical protein [Paenarthrobacter sp. DKR-5]MBT1001393.1 hypothetical protein [Paenarthrobacter sp. DKR-5]
MAPAQVCAGFAEEMIRTVNRFADIRRAVSGTLQDAFIDAGCTINGQQVLPV